MSAGEQHFSGPGTVYAPDDAPSRTEPPKAPEPVPSSTGFRQAYGVIELPDGESFEIHQSEIVVGCGREAQVRVCGRGISKKHLVLRVSAEEHGLEVFDCSSNWTLVDGVRMEKERWQPLPDGCELNLAGAAKLRMRRAR